MPPKKRKPAANPSRGFATTSVASKPKTTSKSDSAADSAEASSKDLSKNTTANVTGTASPAPAKQPSQQPESDVKTKELHELSPEELERRLEEADLQNFVDKYLGKSVRDSTRSIAKLQTDFRLLKAQAQVITTRFLISDEDVLRLVELAQDEVNQGKHLADQDVSKTSLSADELTSRIWTLQKVLLGLAFSESQVDGVLHYLVQFPPPSEKESPVWAFDEALDWLCCNIPEEDLPVFDSSTGKAIVSPQTLYAESVAILDDEEAHEDKSSAAKVKKHDVDVGTSLSQLSDFEVSDVDSDQEPDQLQDIYLRTKTRLFEINPDLAPAPRGKKQAARPSTPVSNKYPRGVLRLQEKLNKIERDALFDQGAADLQWSSDRVLLAREDAERKQTQLSGERKQYKASGVLQPASSEAKAPKEHGPEPEPEDEDDNSIADMFGAVGLDADEKDNDEQIDYKNMQIREFGTAKGLDPRRVLEEACKARDSGFKTKYKLVSTAAFANRHSLVITWSKPHAVQSYPLENGMVESAINEKKMAFTMKTISTPDASQSLAYISTFALFQIFSTSTKEEKAHLRLPQNWRTLWFEFVESSKTQAERKEREVVQHLRQIVASRPPDPESDDDIIFTKNFKKRSEALNRDGNSPGPTAVASQDAIKKIWSEKTATPQYKHMLQVRSALPMSKFKAEALEAISKSQVLVLCGETGCGKSTQMPAFILEQEMSQGRPCKIYCTEPRRISAITLAQRVSEELGEHKGQIGSARSLVGYSIRLESKTSSATRLVYATTGVVLRMLEQADTLGEITHIVIDEVHERSIETDFLLIVLRTLCGKRPDLKVILMSATVDAQRFSAYFYGAPVLNVPGRTFPVETKFLEDAVELVGYTLDDDDQGPAGEEDDEADAEAVGEQATKPVNSASYLKGYSKRTRDTLSKMHHYNIDYRLIVALIENLAGKPGFEKYNRAMLVFLPGIAEIRRMADMLSGSWVGERYLIHSLHSSIASEDQQAAFQLPPHGLGKIVLSTNIAETGVTIPDITCVIDTGQHKEMRFDERRQISKLLNSAISRANAKQRRGRAGRVQEGLCFHLFTKQRHDEVLADQQTPEMLRLSLQDLIMRVKICKLGDIQATLADALDPPQPKNIRRAIDALIEVGALTQHEELTSLGHQLSKMPLDPYLGKLVLFGTFFGCLDVTLTLAAMLTSKSAFTSPIGARKQADVARAAFKKGDSDLLTEFNAYNTWRKVCSSGGVSEFQFCRKEFLSVQNLCNIEDLKAQLLSNLADAGFVSLSSDDRKTLSRISNTTSRTRRFVTVPAAADANSANAELIAAVIAWAFYPKLLTRDGKGWRNIATNANISVHPTSIIRQAPSSSFTNVKLLSYYSILQSSSGARNLNASSLTPANGIALALVAGAAAFQPTAHVVSIDGARLRLAIDAPRQRVWGEMGKGESAALVGAWKTFVALKFLRRKLDDAMRRRWKRPQDPLPGSLVAWMEVWQDVVQKWAAAEA